MGVLETPLDPLVMAAKSEPLLNLDLTPGDSQPKVVLTFVILMPCEEPSELLEPWLESILE